MSTALLLIDMQKDYFPGGKMELEGALEASQQARHVLMAFRQKGWPVIHVQHISLHEGAGFLLPGTQGVEFHRNVVPWPDEIGIQKHYPNAFMETRLLEVLQEKGVRKLVICGMMTQLCVDATTRAAYDLGFTCTVVEDACAAKSLRYKGQHIPAQQVHAAFMAALDGVYAKVLSVHHLVAER